MSGIPSAAPAPAPGHQPENRTAEPDPTIGSRADVATGTPARYAKQLVSHLGRKLAFTGDATTAAASTVIGSATAGIVAGEGVLTLWAASDDEESLARAEQVLGGHLERFAQREAVTVTWVRTVGVPVPTPTVPATNLEESA